MDAMKTRGSGGEEELWAPLLLDAGKRWPAGRPTLAERAAMFTLRGLLTLLWVHLFISMREYAIKYTDGDVLFSTFAAIVVAVPIAEIFRIIASPPFGPSEFFCCDSDSEEVDLEKGPTSGHTPADAMSRAAIKAKMDMDTKRVAICIVWGLVVLLWVLLVDLIRIYIATHDVGVELFIMTPLLIILATGVCTFLFLVMCIIGEIALRELSDDGEL